eukprot:TRINITY_DN18151_c2_g1_i1.p1 TRINITY_DN18151_c2_g1~~TRINITY_DN18151_c2_g1_i1.p1  ORF type:complete len:786 (+),score=181.57 TRINITY_DN18151_c2_g1_i1:67-2424(+)
MAAASRSVEMLCEEERIRRLSERMCCDSSDGAEPARERRARNLVRAIFREGVVLDSLGRSAQAVRVLEAGLEARWRAVLDDMVRLEKSAEPRQKNSLGAVSVAAAKDTRARVPSDVVEREEPRLKAPVQEPEPASAEVLPPSKGSSLITKEEAVDPQSRLSAALDGVTVRGVVSFRALAEVSQATEAVAVAVLRLAGSADRSDAAGSTATSSTPPKDWEEARRILLKPGQFVSSLRRYPYSAERGQVSESDICASEEALAEVPPNGDGLQEDHEMAAVLFEWLRAALEYAAWSRARLQDVASPARATRAPQRSPAPQASVPSAAPAPPAIEASSNVKTGGYPSSATATPERRSSQQRPAVGPRQSSPSSTLLRRPPGSVLAPTASPQTGSSSKSSATTGAPRTTGSGLLWGSLSSQGQERTPDRNESRGVPAPVPTRSRVSTSSSTAQASSPLASPYKQASSAKTALATAARPKQAAAATTQSSNQRRSPDVAGSGSLQNSVAAARSPSQNGSSSSRPRGTLAQRSPSRNGVGIRSASGSRSSTVATLGSSSGANGTVSVASNGYHINPAQPTAGDFAAMRVKIEQEKKEVQQIKAIQSQLKWDIEREEKRQTAEERSEEARKIMEWREAQEKGMREYVEEKTREQRVQELLENKDFQVFKREWKQAMRNEEIERIKEQLAEDLDNAHWKVELQKAIAIDRQAQLQDRLDESEELRQIKQDERVREKAQQEEERTHELALEFVHQANQVASEKEELLRSLSLLRAAQKAPAGGNKAGNAFWPGRR